MWSSLPSNLRSVLGAALILGVGVAMAAFTLSFFALRDAAQDPALAWGSGHAWLFPIGIDMALVFFEVLLIGASMVRVQERGQSVPYPRAVPFLLMLVAAGATLYFNAIHVPEQVRLLALAVPVASILVTLGLAYLLKMLARTSGADYIYEAPVEADPRKITRREDIVDGELIRTDVPSSDLSSSSPRRLDRPSNGHGASTRDLVEAHLAALSPKELQNTSEGEVYAALRAAGVSVSKPYVGRVLGQWRAVRPDKTPR